MCYFVFWGCHSYIFLFDKSLVFFCVKWSNSSHYCFLVHLFIMCFLVFGCICFVHNVTPGRYNLIAKAFKCLFLGYCRLQKGYHCYSLEFSRYIVLADITIFDQQPSSLSPIDVSQVYIVLPFLSIILLLILMEH